MNYQRIRKIGQSEAIDEFSDFGTEEVEAVMTLLGKESEPEVEAKIGNTFTKDLTVVRIGDVLQTKNHLGIDVQICRTTSKGQICVMGYFAAVPADGESKNMFKAYLAESILSHWGYKLEK